MKLHYDEIDYYILISVRTVLLLKTNYNSTNREKYDCLMLIQLSMI